MDSPPRLFDDAPLPPKVASFFEGFMTEIVSSEHSLDDLSLGTQALLRSFVHPTELQSLRWVSHAIKDAVRPVSMHIYVLGGFNGTEVLDSVEHMDPSRGLWETLPRSMPQRLSVAECGTYHGRLYIMSGMNKDVDRDTMNTWSGCYDPYLASWKPLPALTTARACPAAVIIEGWFVVAGGKGLSGVLNSAERYQLEGGSGEWEALPAMSSKRYVTSCGNLQGRMYVCGGNDGVNDLNSAEYLNIGLMQWCSAPPMMETRMGAASAVLGQCLYICGGSGGDIDKQHRCSAERFDVRLDAWEALPPMTERRFKPGAIALAGCIYICGGNAGPIMGPGPRLASVERFNPVEGRWENIAPLALPRAAPLCAALLGPAHNRV